MTTAPVQAPAAVARPRFEWLERAQFWAALTIAVMWLAVLFVGVYGPDIVGSDGTRFPSVVAVAFFACLATVSIGRRAFD